MTQDFGTLKRCPRIFTNIVLFYNGKNGLYKITQFMTRRETGMNTMNASYHFISDESRHEVLSYEVSHGVRWCQVTAVANHGMTPGAAGTEGTAAGK